MHDAHETSSAAPQAVTVRIKRQSSPSEDAYWEIYQVPYRKGLNVLSLLMEIRRNPVTVEGKTSTPVVWESNCLEEVCGACTMVINGRVRQSCSALIDHLEQPITLEPMTKFPVVRDLAVDRSRMFEDLKKVKAWVEIDGYYALGPGPRMSQSDQEKGYPLSRCMTCGCCLEACPQINENSKFIGPAAISQVRLMNLHPNGALNAHERLEALMEEGGITDCGDAQACITVCPKEIPLTDSIAKIGRETTIHSIKKLFGG